MAPLQPSVWLTFNLEQVPEGAGTTVYRWAKQPLADAGAWKEGRVLTWGAIERALSTSDGDYDVASCQVTIDDSDGLFRGLLSGVSTRYFTSREAAIELLSQAGRAAGLTPRSLFRGRVTDVQATPGRRVTLKLADVLGSRFSGFDLDKKIPQATIAATEHPNASADALGRVYPIVVGEHSDVGVVDENGNAADKGLLPVVDVGDYMVLSTGDAAPADLVPQFLPAPSNVDASASGTAGTTVYSYGVTARSAHGETIASTVSIVGADALNATDAIALTWDAVEGAIDYRVYGRLANAGRRYLATVTTTSWTDDGSVTPGATAAPETNSAQAEQAVGSASAFGWGMLLVSLGAIENILHVYASDLNAGGTPKRVRMDESAYGVDILAPGRPGWPFADTYFDVNGIRMTAIFARGERLAHHRDRTVTITVNACGAEDVGDGSGVMLDEAFVVLQWFLNEHVLKDAGVGYRSGAYGPLETYANGDEILQTSKFADAQALTVTWMGGAGYLAAFALTEPISLREFLRRFCVTFACHVGTNHFGQVFPVLVDDTADPTDGRLYRDRIEIHRLASQEFDHDAVETRVRYHYDWDTEAGKFRVVDQVLEDAVATANHLQAREREIRQCYYTRDAGTAGDSNGRHLTRYKVAPRYVAFDTDLTGLEDDNGTQIRLTHYDGAGSADGDVATPFLVTKHRVDPNAPERVTLTGFDLSRILNSSLPALVTDASAAVLGDETSASPPTTGAYELR